MKIILDQICKISYSPTYASTASHSFLRTFLKQHASGSLVNLQRHGKSQQIGTRSPSIHSDEHLPLYCTLIPLKNTETHITSKQSALNTSDFQCELKKLVELISFLLGYVFFFQICFYPFLNRVLHCIYRIQSVISTSWFSSKHVHSNLNNYYLLLNYTRH